MLAWIGKAADVNLRPGRVLPGGRHALKLALHGAVSGEAVHEHVPFGDLVVNVVMEVGEGGAERREEHLQALAIGRYSGRGAVIDVVGGEVLVYGGHVPLVENFCYKATIDGDTFFC